LLDRRDFPLLDAVRSVDHRSGELVAERTFTVSRDRWLADHLPTRRVSPLVAGVMAVEAMIESARALHPALVVREARQVVYREILECPLSTPRPAVLSCRNTGSGPDGTVCHVSLASAALSPSGRALDRVIVHYEADVVLGAAAAGTLPVSDLALEPSAFDTPRRDRAYVLDVYEDRSGLSGRFLVLQTLDGTTSDTIRGTMVCHPPDDVLGITSPRYSTDPYVLEGIHHLALFHMVELEPEERRVMLPASVSRLVSVRAVEPGEGLGLEGRRRERTAAGTTWDARAVDGQGRVVLAVEGLRLLWLD
jgi:hypothetical protein